MAVIAAGGGMGVYGFAANSAPDSLPDSLVIGNQKNLPEVKAFLAKYPDAGVMVDRSGRLAVDYRVDKQLSNSTDSIHTLRLRVFSDNLGRPQEMYVDCANDKNLQLKYDDILNYVRTESCL